MKTIGLIGGMSWESSAEYYALINRLVNQRLGGFHSAKLLLYSVDFEPIEALQRAERWDEMGAMLAEAARALEAGGAELYGLATNTMHLCWPAITAAVNIPGIHIVDACAAAIERTGLKRVALLGTRYTMEKPFYIERLRDQFGIEASVPDVAGRAEINRVIFEELVHGVIRDESRRAYQAIIGVMADQGAQGVILGCTEIGLLIKPEDVAVPCFDTTALHCEALVDLALAEG